jgi:predicted dehydrogenase (TIGR03970 family)
MMSIPSCDVLIVGAGSAGSVLAERLSRDPACQVAIIEQGPDLSDPTVAGLTKNGSALPIGLASPVVRHYPTTLTSHPHRPVRLVRGAVVGGSGAVNGGYFCRGLPEDFARWQLPGWSWSEVVDHFRAVETDLDFSGPLHGAAGPIPVRRSSELSPSTESFVAGALDAQYAWIDDLNGEPAEQGLGPVPLNIVDGVRTGPGLGCLQLARDRDNLTVLAHVTAQSVRFNGGRAIGVDALSAGKLMRLTADRIVLSAGAIGSAHLLMLSGIGDEAVLRRAGVPLKVSLPVGTHCVDHPEWVLSADWGTQVQRPVLEVVLHTADHVEIRPYTGGFVAMMGDRAGHPDWPHIGVGLMRPQARGRVSLISGDPRVPPRIEHRYDSEPADVAALREGAELVREIWSAKTRLGEPIWSTSQHLCGTVPMGPDEHAALDARCRVRGIEGLWVVDGSAMPTITSRGPHATIAMLAHRAAEFIQSG